MSALALSGVSKRFGGLQALNELSLSVEPGEVLGLIGPNGAGKSTLVACITGVLRIDAGAIRFQGHDIQRLPPHQRARRGIARTFQKVRLADQLTVYENVAAGLASRWFAQATGWLAAFRPSLGGECRRSGGPHAGASRTGGRFLHGGEIVTLRAAAFRRNRTRACVGTEAVVAR